MHLADIRAKHLQKIDGTGRVDLLLKSKDGKLPDYIFEFKVSKKRKHLKKDAEKAFTQIEKKQYGVEMHEPVKMGISFYGKEMHLVHRLR